MARWSVELIGKKMKHLGTVVAENEKKAIEEAVKQFGIEPALRNKVTVTKVSERN